MIKNILFDMGDVIIAIENLKSIRPFFENDEDARLIEKETFLSEEWNLLDNGLIDFDEAVKEWKNRVPERLHQNMLNAMKNHGLYLEDKVETLKIIDKLKENGYKLYLFTNLNLLDYENIIKKRIWYPKFDGKIVSAKVKVLKPEKEIYIKLLEKYNLKPDECYFIDDKQVNVDAGRKLGIKGHVFSDVEELKKDFEKEGIKIF